MKLDTRIMVYLSKHAVRPYKSSMVIISSPALNERIKQSVAASPDEKSQTSSSVFNACQRFF
jgi:hypothetical protein